MSNETFKKRQKEMARREKQQKKAARRMERRNDQALNRVQLPDESGQTDSTAGGGEKTL
jgi:hypothetical protein